MNERTYHHHHHHHHHLVLLPSDAAANDNDDDVMNYTDTDVNSRYCVYSAVVATAAAAG